MKYLNKTFNVNMSGNKQYDKNYDRIFHKSWKERFKLWIEKLLIKIFFG